MLLSRHLTASTAEHGRLAFHPSCPRCKERLAGALGEDTLVSRRAQAVLAAGLLAFSTAAPPAVAQVGEIDAEQEGTAVPGGDQPGLEPDFDPGGDDALDVDTAPIVDGPPDAGGQEDDGLGAPVEGEPATDPDALVLVEDEQVQPVPPPPPTTPAPAPSPPPPVPVEPPVAPPAAEVDQAAGPEAPSTAVEPKAQKRGAKPRKPRRQTADDRGPAPQAVNTAPVVETAVPTAPAETIPVTQPVAAVGGAVEGSTYTIRPGDSLWSIARRMLGPGASMGQVARQVNRLWELNRNRIGTGNPSLVYAGTTLRLK